jgi:hypothetical protein
MFSLAAHVFLLQKWSLFNFLWGFIFRYELSLHIFVSKIYLKIEYEEVLIELEQSEIHLYMKMKYLKLPGWYNQIIH